MATHPLRGTESEDPEEVFQLLDVIGEGSYGFICTCKDTKKDKVFAVKFLELDENDPKELQKEMDILAECKDCPYTVKYHGCYVKEGSVMFVMEYCEGGSVLDMMQLGKVKLSEDHVAIICAHVVQGLTFLHSHKILHRDLKAGNVLLSADGTAKLADFGVSAKLTKTFEKKKSMVGSPYWMAPEVISVSGPPTPDGGYTLKADIWSLGITAIEMADGQPPLFDISSMRVIFLIPKQPPPTLKETNKWSPEFNDFIRICLQKEPEKRPPVADLLKHPFIQKGIANQKILKDLVVSSIPAINIARQKKREERERASISSSDSSTKGSTKSKPKSGTLVRISGRSGTFVINENQN